MRGVQGCGKTTLAHAICDGHVDAVVYAADDYFDQPDGTYLFDADKLYAAHKTCQRNTETAMEVAHTQLIIVTNTFATERELKPYVALAEKHGYRLTSVVVENRHGNKDVHNVPQEVREAIAGKIKNSIKLV